MKLLSVVLARSVWFLDVNELNPGGKDFFVHLFPMWLDDYKFKIFPKAGEDFTQGMKFTGGEFVKEDGTVLALNLILFNDGISAETYSSTKDSDAFLEAVLSDLPEMGFAYEPEMVIRKAYDSQLLVRCQRPLSGLNPKLAEFSTKLSSAVGGTQFDISAIEYWPDQEHVYKPVNFSFQRKTGHPSSSGRYWSQAPLPTDKHLELLEELESLLLS